MRVLSVCGVPFEADIPFSGLHALLLPAALAIDRLTAVQAGGLRSALGLGDRAEVDRLVVGAATLSLVSAFADDGPVLIVIDDAHWLDRASAEAMAFAARRLIADPVAILVAVRDGEPSPLLEAGLAELRLSGLDRASGLALLKRGAGRALPGEKANRIFDATGGNPLALIELAGDASDLAIGAEGVPLPLATSVEREYTRRANGLSRGAQRALLVLAAAPNAGWDVVQDACSDLGVEEHALEEMRAADGLITNQSGSPGFRHPLALAAVYHGATQTEMRSVHRALSRVMTAPDQSDMRAWHLAGAAVGYDAEAAATLEEVARRASARGAFSAAIAALRESARLTEDALSRAARMRSAAECLWIAGEPEQVPELLDQARSLAGQSHLRVAIDALQGVFEMQRGEVDGGSRILRQAATSIQIFDRQGSIRLLADAALGSYAAGRPADMLAVAGQAIDLLQPGDPIDLLVLAHTAYGLGAVLAGHEQEGPEHLREAIDALTGADSYRRDPRILMCAVLAALSLRESETGRALIDWAQDAARDSRPGVLPTVLFFLARDEATTDRWLSARAHYEEAAALARELKQLTALAGALAGLAWLDALEGREEDCRRHAKSSMSLNGAYRMGFFDIWALMALGELELGSGTPEAAAKHLEACAEQLSERGIGDPDLAPTPDLVEAYVRVGRVVEASLHAERYSRAASAKGQPFALARAGRSLAIVAEGREFEDLFEGALKHHEKTPDLFERARTQLAYGERLRRARRRVDARVQLRSALATFDKLGAAPWAERTRTELLATGETARRRDDSTRLDLTPQELQIALSLVAGLKTRETAAKLYLSPKTVEYHLHNVYGKLGIHSRDELRESLEATGGV